MTLERRVGQLFWCGWGDGAGPGARTLTPHARWLLEELGCGGIVLFDRNLGSPEEVAALNAEIRAAAAGPPPLIGVDQEGGRVCRLRYPGMVFPGNMALGALDAPQVTREVHRTLAEQLAALGFDVDFAPSLDVNNNPLNPVIGTRSFGDDPELVARHGVAAVAGFREIGVLPVVKHFPGHGDTSVDSHLALPVQPAGRERLDSVELLPFPAALAAGAPAVMTSHIRFPALDPELPSTLSPAILTGLLRGELGFDGLVVTDCLEMRGIADHWGPEEAAVLAVLAGADMLLVCHTRETQARMHAAVCAAVRSGRLPESRVDESLARIARARELTEAVRSNPPPLDRVGDPGIQRAELAITRTTFVASDGAREGMLRPELPVVVSGAAETASALAERLRDAGYEARSVAWSPAAAEALRSAPQLAWAALPRDPFPDGVPDSAAASLLAAHPCALVVAAAEPYCLERYPASVPKLRIWGARPRPHLTAAAAWLRGETASKQE